jgi:outer membrane lipopolysaccharide assembly protein LptE/RlpB
MQKTTHDIPEKRREGRFFSRNTALGRLAAAGAAIAMLALLAQGCGYQLGTQGKIPFSTLQIATVRNETLAPQIQAPLHEQLAAAFAREGGLSLVSEASQATLRVRVTRYSKEIAATKPRDTGLAASFTLKLTAVCDLLNNADPANPYFEGREISVSITAHTPETTGATGGFSAVEYQTLPELTRNLARRIRDTVTGVW